MDQHCLNQIPMSSWSWQHFYSFVLLLKQGHRFTCLKWQSSFSMLDNSYKKAVSTVTILAKSLKWMTIRSSMQKVMSLTIHKWFSEKLMPCTWLYLHATKHTWYIPSCLILKIHLFFTHLQLRGIKLLCVFCHTCCFFMPPNSFQMAWCHIFTTKDLDDSRLFCFGWLGVFCFSGNNS